MSLSSKTPSEKSVKQELKSQTSELQLEKQLERELLALRSELNTLKKEKPNKQVQKETQKLESTIGEVLLDLAEEIPLLGKGVKWFRTWING